MTYKRYSFGGKRKKIEYTLVCLEERKEARNKLIMPFFIHW